MPVTPDEFESRFKAYLNQELKGKDRKNIRIVIEEK